MIWKSFKEEKEAREMYEKHREKAARMLYQYEVIEKDGDNNLT